MSSVKNVRGVEIQFEAAVALMDDSLRESLHNDGHLSDLLASLPANQRDQLFFEQYAAAHKSEFGEDFAPYAGLAW